ncbi:RNA polymerase sigma factor, sigma-70 family [Alteribacillus persepolensis]|uniref:RNA polymerase sigma factor, sigma-70 family n=1 Tax=Alteribacillus persepolensis TaxID=568899 RepID=A0A1G8ASY1_9BACI|nr:sigma-70 family RNA polymerase sigma factor [Alteribacillus persepolensis]SDH23964.1 RNA polymerase sigma factor, sigma-70 family [Alteribacillus persepolensis]
MNDALGIPFEEVAEDFAPLVFGMIKRLKIYKNTEEYAHIGFIALWKAYQQFDPAKGAFSSFAYSYVRGDMLAHLKKEARYDERYQPISFTDYTEPTDPHSETIQQQIQSIAPYIEDLTPRERDWVVQYIIYGRGITEIANRYNVAASTVKSWRKHALRKLREQDMKKRIL